MTNDEVLDIFRDCGAILDGHFVLTSGLHSPMYLQKAFVFMWPDKTEILCRALAEAIQNVQDPGISDRLRTVTKVVSPAVGGIIPGYETARHLGLPAIYTERVEGKFQLRRGFSVEPGEKVLVVEDVISTGGSVKECVECLQELGADVVAVACLVDRSAGRADIGIPLISLAEYQVPAYPADALPPELAAQPAITPGSHHAR